MRLSRRRLAIHGREIARARGLWLTSRSDVWLVSAELRHAGGSEEEADCGIA